MNKIQPVFKIHFVFTFHWGVLKYVLVTPLALYRSRTVILQNLRKTLQAHSLQAQPFSKISTNRHFVYL